MYVLTVCDLGLSGNTNAFNKAFKEKIEVSGSNIFSPVGKNIIIHNRHHIFHVADRLGPVIPTLIFLSYEPEHLRPEKVSYRV